MSHLMFLTLFFFRLANKSSSNGNISEFALLRRTLSKFRKGIIDFFYRSLTTVSYYNDINTLEELDQLGQPIAPTFFTFTADTSKVMKNLKQRKVRPTRENILKVVAYNRSIAKLERKRDIMWVLKTNFVYDEGEPLLHIVDECFTTFYISFIVPKNSIFLPTFNDVIIKLFENGLTNKWYEDVQFISFVAKMDDMKVKTETSESISFDEIRRSSLCCFWDLL
ncbi:hypothetical protein Zmor_018608 [Zophobas morio]|uniref:Uncharacterized protein n=1 Tax=Zophobas morio TaxID=2755281 RepID=A0AA38IER2_9CUCU|nr:hypothetical protein Zmor_018608 [Zophobas morio]